MRLQELEATVALFQHRFGVEQDKRVELEDSFYRLGEEAAKKPGHGL